MCINSCSFPDALKCAQICPIHNKDSSLNITNYRPVSVLPSLSKIFEKVLVEQLSDYFEYIFNEEISRFRCKHSCETILVRMIEDIRQYLDEGKIVCVLLTDLSPAFDSISYKLRISKLYAYGLSYEAYELLLSYYKNQKQQVRLRNVHSEWKSIYKGSAQGSIVGPISYNIFSNDMLSVLDNDVYVYNYVGDNPLLCAGYDYDITKQKLTDSAGKLIEWFQQNNMKINPIYKIYKIYIKFKYIVFGKHESPGSIMLNNTTIFPDTTVKILGLKLDNKLLFNNHISTICTKAGRQIQVSSVEH